MGFNYTVAIGKKTSKHKQNTQLPIKKKKQLRSKHINKFRYKLNERMKKNLKFRHLHTKVSSSI